MMRMFLVTLLLVSLVSPSTAAPFGADPTATVSGQLTDLVVQGGYHTGGGIVLYGTIDAAEGGLGRQTVVWVNGFSTVVEPEGTFFVWVPVAAFPLPAHPRGTIATVKAKQYGTAVTLQKTFDLAQLNRVLDRPISRERLELLHER